MTTSEERTEYQRMRRGRVREFMASYTPEQKRLQAREIEIDQRWQKTKDARIAVLLKKEHKEVVDRLIVLIYPPDGYTPRIRKQQKRKEAA